MSGQDRFVATKFMCECMLDNTNYLMIVVVDLGTMLELVETIRLISLSVPEHFNKLCYLAISKQ